MHTCNTSGCIGGWASVYFKKGDDSLEGLLKYIFEITQEESEFVCYGYSWELYEEPASSDLEDFSEAMRRFDKLIAHYEFLGGKQPRPECYVNFKPESI